MAAFENRTHTLPGQCANAAMPNPFRLVKIVGEDLVEYAQPGDRVVGITGCNAYEEGDAVNVNIDSATMRVEAGEPIPAGEKVKAGVDGVAMIAAAGDEIIGHAVTTTTVAGELISVMIGGN